VLLLSVLSPLVSAVVLELLVLAAVLLESELELPHAVIPATIDIVNNAANNFFFIFYPPFWLIGTVYRESSRDFYQF
jgi:hypothetical protein